MRGFILSSIVILLVQHCLAQCPTVDFEIQANGCMEENLYIQNNSTDANFYTWDFCSGDFQFNPIASPILTNSSLTQAWSIRVGEDQNVWYGFAISVTLNRLFRFDFGGSLNNVPTFTDLGNPGNLLNGATDFQLFQEGVNWYALVPNSNTNHLLRLSFGSSLSSIPSAQNLGNVGSVLKNPNGVVIVNDGTQTLAFVTNGGASEIIRLDFDNSILNTPNSTVLPLAGGSGLRGIAITKECNRWYGLVLSYANNKVFYLDFTAGINQNFTSDQISFFTAYNFPSAISINYEGGEYYAFIQSALGSVYRLSYGSSIIDGVGTGTDLGNLGISGSNFAQSWANDGTDWFGFSIDRATGRLVRITLPVTCSASSPVLTTVTPPPIQYSTSGTKRITLLAKDINDHVKTTVKTISINSDVAPDLEFTTQDICANNPVHFELQNLSGNLVSANWDFGDGNNSAGISLDHVFAVAGTFQVTLIVQASNACENTLRKPLAIFESPQASFTQPPGLVCTNNEFTFVNTTPDNFDGNLIYQWFVDGILTNTTRDLPYTFTTGGDKEISLQTSIPGCSSESIQVLTGVGEGPVVDFTIEGACLNENVQLINGSSGDIASYAWNFGDGQTSIEQNPVVSYEAIGTYAIELETTGNNGCVSTKVTNHQVFSAPQPNFNTDLPPFSCNGTPTQFNDLTPPLVDSNMESWLWDFNDNGATADSQSPTYTYTLSGNYDVTLTVTSDQGCSGQLMKNITISESPSPSIVNTAACVNTGVEFTTSSAQPIEEWRWQIGNNYYFTESPSHIFDEHGDFTVSLAVTGQNGCMNTSSKDVFIPIPIGVDFTSTKKCVDADAEFIAVTNAEDDLPSAYEWTLDGVEKQGQIISHSFARADLYEVLLRVTSESGCVYSLNKAQTVLEKPHADFSFSPESGTPPLSVQFTNASTNADAFLWRFNDSANSTSTSVSPNFVFTEIGNYPVDLLATNEEGCESTISKLINVALPLLFVSLDQFEVIQGQNGLLQMRVTINNEGNVDLQNLPLAVSLNNGTELYETVSEVLFGGESKTVVLATSISKTPGLQFLCLTLELDNNSAGATEELCLSLEGSTVFTAPHPNPAKDAVTLEWIAVEEENITLSVVNTVGKEMLSISFLSQQGLNSHVLSTAQWQEGLYFVKIQSPGVDHTFRIIIVR